MQDAMFPDRDEAHLVIQVLLDLVQQRFPLLTVTLLALLGIPGIDLWVLDPRLHPGARHEGIKARGGAAKGGTALHREGPVRLFSMGRLVGSTLHSPHLGPNAHSREVVHNRLSEASEGVIDRTVPGLEAVGISGLGEELP